MLDEPSSAGLDEPSNPPNVLDDALAVLLGVNVDERAGTASLDVLREPLVWWLWFGGGLMLLGTLVAAWPSSAGRSSARAKPQAAK